MKSRRIIRVMILFLMFFTGLLLSIFLPGYPASAQTIYGDEWINTRQTYLRIPITKTGLYSITGQELISAGLSVTEIPAASLQMFRRGKELAIEVRNESSENLSANSSISFYAERNDGALDSALYVRPAFMPHSNYSLYSDTAAYFLTWRKDGGTGKRIVRSESKNITKTLNYHFEVTSELFNSNYLPGNFYPAGSNFDTGTLLSTYDNGEGWTGKELNNDWQTVDINMFNPDYEHMDQCEIELVLAGRSAGMHEIEIWTGTGASLVRKITTIRTSNYNSTTYKFLLKKEDIAPNDKIAVSIHATKNTGSISISYVQWRYPQKTTLTENFLQKIFYFGNNPEPGLWNIRKDRNRQFYDCSDPHNLLELEQNNNGITLDGSKKIIGIKEPLKTDKPRLVNFQSIETLETDYLIITHPLVRKPINGIDPVEAYASYRASKEGGGYQPFIIECEEIFDRFNYGEPGPQGIRNMIAGLYRKNQLKFVFIIGRSVDPQTARKSNKARELDMIPNAGWPGSDLALSMGLEGADAYVALVPVGRINAANPENVWTYLQKVKAMEAEPASASWRKNILHLSGGRSKEELVAFRNYVYSFERKIYGSSLGAHVQTISKQTDAEVEQFPIHIPLNRGVALMTLYGHSGLDVTDIDIGFVSDTTRKYRNNPYYPAVIVNGCALGSIFYSTKTISTDWIFSPDKGAVLFLAHTFNGLSTSLKHYTDSFYEVLADPQFVSEPFGTIQQEAIRRNMHKYPDLAHGITAQQMNLHGDPAIKIFPARLPDYAFDSTFMKFSDPSGNRLSTFSDTILVELAVVNNGRLQKEPYTLLLEVNNGSTNQFTVQYLNHAVDHADTLVFKIPNSFRNSEKLIWKFTIDPENRLQEESKVNNVFSTELFIPAGGAFPLLPLPDHVTNVSKIELIAQIPFERNRPEVVFEWDTTSSFSTARRITKPAENYISSHYIFVQDAKKQKIFWRVYLPEDHNRPSQSRIINYFPGHVPFPVFPEGIGLNLKSYLPDIAEGDTFRSVVSYQNVTGTAFQDSLSLKVIHNTLRKTETILLKIPALKAREMRNVAMDFGTISEPGPHKISFLFNAGMLPEQIYTNNEVHLSYRVMPDRLPPLLSVSVDDRQLADQEYVSSQPIIGIQVLDENKFLIRKDTSGIEIWLKEGCMTCKEQKISLAGSEMISGKTNHFQIRLKLPQPLANGIYLLKVKARDLSGNAAPDYQIYFRIKDALKIVSSGVSPNPATQWFRFFLELEGTMPEEKFVISIHDLAGRKVRQIRARVHTGKNEWFWQPGILPAGIYFYHMEADYGKLASSTGVITGLHGKLIWVR